MPDTRAQSRSRAPVGATAAVERAAPVENSTSADPPAVSQGNRAEMMKKRKRMSMTPKLTSPIKLGS